MDKYNARVNVYAQIKMYAKCVSTGIGTSHARARTGIDHAHTLLATAHIYTRTGMGA